MTGETSCGSASPSKSRVTSASVMSKGMPPTNRRVTSGWVLRLGVTVRVRARARIRVRVRVSRVDLGFRGARLAAGGGRSDAGRDPRDAAGSDHGLARLGQEQRRGRRPDADPHRVAAAMRSGWMRCRAPAQRVSQHVRSWISVSRPALRS